MQSSKINENDIAIC